MRTEEHDLHGAGYEEHEVYDLVSLHEHDYWASVTTVPCPVAGCDQTVVWHEAGYVPGYRVCAALGEDPNSYLRDSVRHRFMASGSAKAPVLIRDHAGEEARA